MKDKSLGMICMVAIALSCAFLKMENAGEIINMTMIALAAVVRD